MKQRYGYSLIAALILSWITGTASAQQALDNRYDMQGGGDSAPTSADDFSGDRMYGDLRTTGENLPPINAERIDQYTVQSGDTMWDICGRLLGNPWYWQKVWASEPADRQPALDLSGQCHLFPAGRYGRHSGGDGRTDHRRGSGHHPRK